MDDTQELTVGDLEPGVWFMIKDCPQLTDYYMKVDDVQGINVVSRSGHLYNWVKGTPVVLLRGVPIWGRLERGIW